MTLTTLSPAQRARLFQAMEQRGGSFAQKLAAAWFAADPVNKTLIEATWPRMMEAYLND